MKVIISKLKEERDLLLSKPYQTRYHADQIDDARRSPLIKLITGPRRAGKSVFALQMLKGTNFAYLNFDNEQFLSNFDEDRVEQALEEVFPAYTHLMLDEIQNLPGWDLWVSKLYRRGVNLVVTGSNAKLLSSEMATVLTGRYLPIEILPFSFNEMLSALNTTIKDGTPTEKAQSTQLLDDYLTFGGFPETITMRSIARNYLASLFDSVLLKDVARRFKVRHTTELYNLASYLLTNYTNPFSYSQLAAELNIGSKLTVQKFVGYLAETYIFFLLPRFDKKMRLMQKAPSKIYVVDNGFVAARSFELSPNKGRLLENMVFMELIRRGFRPGLTLFYYHTQGDREIDFVCRTGHQVSQLIQVSYDVSSPKTLARECAALREAGTELHCPNQLLLTCSDILPETEGIELQSVTSWLSATT